MVVMALVTDLSGHQYPASILDQGGGVHAAAGCVPVETKADSSRRCAGAATGEARRVGMDGGTGARPLYQSDTIGIRAGLSRSG